MERRQFINLAAFLPVLKKLKEILPEDELLRFNQSDLEPLYKVVSPANRSTSTLMMKNLLFDVKHILSNSKDFKDVVGLKSLAIEADKKFYEANKLSIKNFKYQALTFTTIEGYKTGPEAQIKEISTMIESLKRQINKLIMMEEKIEDLLPKILNSLSSDTQMQNQKCAQTLSMVGCIIACVIAIIVAIVVTVFSTGAGAGNKAAIIVDATSATLASFIAGSAVIVLTANNISINKTNVSLKDAKIEFSKVNLNKLLKCSVSSVAIASAISAFGTASYPGNPLAGSIAVNLFAIAGLLPGVETVC